ncbi:MAG: hypothetical protein E3K36_02605 [Candidatus Brocadia sp.]|nr:hypothetical protein [Candidatus Brocadia sp.]
MKNIDNLIINSPYEEPQQCGWVKRNGLNTYLLIMMEEDKWKIEGLGERFCRDGGRGIMIKISKTRPCPRSGSLFRSWGCLL